MDNWFTNGPNPQTQKLSILQINHALRSLKTFVVNKVFSVHYECGKQGNN
jgi:hypothetical protein